MNRLIQKILLPLPILVRWYLSKKRTYRYGDIAVDVLPGVFHPGLFFSTKMLMEFVSKQPLKGARVLEVGAGTGIVSILAGKMGATVTATDISSHAVENIHINTKKNNVSLKIVQSDLFEELPAAPFDWIFVNPPYYPRSPRKEEEFAWYCGELHEYFSRFFSTVSKVSDSNTQIIMVLSKVCDLPAITRIAAENRLLLAKLREKKVLIDGENYIFQVKLIA